MTKTAVVIGVLLAGAALALGGCARPGGESPPSAATPGTADPWRETAIWVEQDNETRPFENGTRVAAGGLSIEIFVAPYPPLREGSIDLFLTDPATDRPVEEHAPQIVFDMYMPHGSIRAAALPMGGGHYLIPYKLVMPGEWRADITITGAGGRAVLALIFRVE